MEICRAFNLFEFIWFILLSIAATVTVLNLIITYWNDNRHIKPKSRVPLLSKPSRNEVFQIVAIIVIWILVYLAYFYIKSMFC